jgi:hypothetical protein
MSTENQQATFQIDQAQLQNFVFSSRNRLHVLETMMKTHGSLNEHGRDMLRILKVESTDIVGQAQLGREQAWSTAKSTSEKEVVEDRDLGPAFFQIKLNLALLERLIS